MRAVDRRGGYVNAMTSSDFTTYYATLPTHAAELALQIEADRMLEAIFDPAEVEAERTVVIAEREGSENEPRYVLGEELTATAFRVHPYHHQTIGWKGDLQRLTREQLYTHYKRHYVPNNAVLVVVGDFQADEYLGMARHYLEGIPRGRATSPGSSAGARAAGREEGDVAHARLGAVCCAWHTMPRRNPSRFYAPGGGRRPFIRGQGHVRLWRFTRAQRATVSRVGRDATGLVGGEQLSIPASTRTWCLWALRYAMAGSPRRWKRPCSPRSLPAERSCCGQRAGCGYSPDAGAVRL